eukprot:m.157427 g.157427  ORF g.157427 m.157427 type:complete len:361 (-) comp17970_c0_seq2:957-2039(-)
MPYTHSAGAPTIRELHGIARPCLSCGPHWWPVLFFMIVLIGGLLNLWLYFSKNRADLWEADCVDINGVGNDRCQSGAKPKLPSISRTGQESPENIIFGIYCTIGGIALMFTNYYIHKTTWARVRFLDGIYIIRPLVYCFPFTHRFFRPRLVVMLAATKWITYLAALFFITQSWIPMDKKTNILHNTFAFLFFAAFILYIGMFTLNQHNIKEKLPGAFPAPWRIIVKKSVVLSLVVVGIFLALLFFAEVGESCYNYYTSNLFTWGFSAAEYASAFLVGIFVLTHVEDIRQEDAARTEPICCTTVQLCTPHDFDVSFVGCHCVYTCCCERETIYGLLALSTLQTKGCRVPVNVKRFIPCSHY